MSPTVVDITYMAALKRPSRGLTRLEGPVSVLEPAPSAKLSGGQARRCAWRDYYLIRKVAESLLELFEVFCSTPSPVCVTEALTVSP